MYVTFVGTCPNSGLLIQAIPTHHRACLEGCDKEDSGRAGHDDSGGVRDPLLPLFRELIEFFGGDIAV